MKKANCQKTQKAKEAEDINCRRVTLKSLNASRQINVYKRKLFDTYLLWRNIIIYFKNKDKMARKRRVDRATDKINICEHFDIILADTFTENSYEKG